jgi:peptidoglycan/LPS O-acetylase OafA/YrhL
MKKPSVVQTDGSTKSLVDIAAIDQLARIVSQYDLSEIEVSLGDLQVRLARQREPAAYAYPAGSPEAGPIAAGHAPSPAAAPLATSAPAAELAGAVKSPMVGTAYLRASPEAKPFVEVGNVPFLTASSSLGGPQVFPLNGPQYSLFLEVVINFLWSALRPFNQLWLSLGIFIACLATLPFVGLGGDEAATFWFGLPRVGASFFAGVAVFHVNRAKKRQAEFQRVFWFIAALMGLFFYYPYPLSFPLELIWIALLSPLVVYTGSQIRLSGKIRSVALLGGELSYPIYVLHYPLFCWVNGSYQALTKQQDVVFEGPLILVFVLIGGFLTLKIYDKPFRKWLDRCAAL